MDKASSSRIKKRKTRKCLDELRKKSRQCSSISLNITENNVRDVLSKKSKIILDKNTKVTKNRLTMKLGMFSKGVRSETITRPQLSEEFKARMDENLYKIIDLANGKPSHTVTSGAYEELMRSNGVQIQKQACSPSKHSSNDDSQSPHISKMDTDHSQNSLTQCSVESSPPCFTPPNQAIHLTVPQRPKIFLKESVSDDHIISIDSSSPEPEESLVDGDLHQYFKDFMAEVPEYLNTHLPELMEDDTYESTREYLQRLHTRSCERETEVNVLGCIRSSEGQKINKKSIIQETMAQSILLNPIEYIKKYGQQCQSPEEPKDHPSTLISAKNSFPQRSLTDDSLSRHSSLSNQYVASNLSGAGDSRANYTFLSSSGNISPTEESGDSSARVSAENHCVVSLIEGTPEIRFYPRKLNP